MANQQELDDFLNLLNKNSSSMEDPNSLVRENEVNLLGTENFTAPVTRTPAGLSPEPVVIQETPPSTNMRMTDGFESEMKQPVDPKLNFNDPSRTANADLISQIYQRKADNSGNKSLISAFMGAANLAARKPITDAAPILKQIEATENAPLEAMKEEQNRKTVENNIKATDISNAKQTNETETLMARRSPESKESRNFVNKLAQVYKENGQNGDQFIGLSMEDAIQLDKTSGDLIAKNIQLKQMALNQKNRKEDKAEEKANKSTTEARKEFAAIAKDDIKALNKINEVDRMMKQLKADPKGFLGKAGLGKLYATYNVAKILDPDSAVREGELKLLGASGPLLQRAKQWSNDLINGRLTPEMLNDISTLVNELKTSRLKGLASSTKALRNSVQKQGLDIEQITSLGSSLGAIDSDTQSDIDGVMTGKSPASTNSAPTSSPSDKVKMKTPDGRVVLVPSDKVDEATKKGAERI